MSNKIVETLAEDLVDSLQEKPVFSRETALEPIQEYRKAPVRTTFKRKPLSLSKETREVIVKEVKTVNKDIRNIYPNGEIKGLRVKL